MASERDRTFFNQNGDRDYPRIQQQQQQHLYMVLCLLLTPEKNLFRPFFIFYNLYSSDTIVEIRNWHRFSNTDTVSTYSWLPEDR